ncbi:hypothetical protein [Methanolobus psychrotolerans]|uniref:hypothetical protein n=1 Tax=Methanolobus psychrotolerans TaxID=1874706 RepID=UPI0013EC9184|nr:hypothetical protein [Methanolobus psychrotolerans]
MIIALFFVLFLIPSNADDNDMSINFTLPDYGPEMFEKAKKESNFIAARGTMPLITEDGKKIEWTDQLVECTRNNKEILAYFNDGPVESFGTYIDGYLKVGMESATPEKVNDTIIDEIYEIISEQCEKEGINDVPVVFVWDHEEAIVEEESSSTTVDIFENKSTQNEDDPIQSTPGFTSIMLILCLLILVKYRK